MPVEKTFYYVGKYLVGTYVKIAFKKDIIRAGILPSGPKIIAVNHPTTSDPFIITSLLSGQTKVLIHEALFRIKLFGRYLRLAGHIPVFPAKGYLAYEQAVKTLKSGNNIIVFIEGGLSPRGGGFNKPKTGAVRLSLATGAPIIPIGVAVAKEDLTYIKTMIDGTEEQAVWLKRGPYAITIGEPLYFTGNINDHAYVKTSTRLTMDRIINLAGQSSLRLESRKIADSIFYYRLSKFASFFRLSLVLRSIITFFFPPFRT